MGNYSRDTFDRLKHYVNVRLQQGVPIVDADWNELQDIRKDELETFLKWFVGNGVPLGNDGFAIGAVTDGNDFSIAAGHCLVEGWDVINESALSYTEQTEVPLLVTPSSDRTDTVYLDVWEREVDAEEAPEIVNPGIGIETCVRTKREWVVRVAEDATQLPAPPPGHVFYPLATLNRKAGQDVIDDVTDLRQTGLTLAGKVDRAGDRITGDLAVGGRLGIGTTDPGAARIALVTPRSSPTTLSLWQQGVASAFLGNISWDTNFYIINTYHPGVEIGTPDKSLTLTRDGSVGIGTTSPGAKLEINGGNPHKYIRFHPDGSSIRLHNPWANYSSLRLYAGGNYTKYGWLFRANRDGLGSSLTIGKDDEPSGTYSKNLTITAAGNVGIGTGSPQVPLDVHGAIRAGGYSRGNGSIQGYAVEVGGTLPTAENRHAVDVKVVVA